MRNGGRAGPGLNCARSPFFPLVLGAAAAAGGGCWGALGCSSLLLAHGMGLDLRLNINMTPLHKHYLIRGLQI